MGYARYDRHNAINMISQVTQILVFLSHLQTSISNYVDVYGKRTLRYLPSSSALYQLYQHDVKSDGVRKLDVSEFQRISCTAIFFENRPLQKLFSSKKI